MPRLQSKRSSRQAFDPPPTRASAAAAPTRCEPGMPLLGRNCRRESLATLRAAALQDRATRLGLHALTEAVLSETFDSTRLKCPLHLCGSSLSRVFRALRVVLGGSLATALEIVAIEPFLTGPAPHELDGSGSPAVSCHSLHSDRRRTARTASAAAGVGSERRIERRSRGARNRLSGSSSTSSAVCSPSHGQSHGRPGKRGSLPVRRRTCQCTDFRVFAGDCGRMLG